MSDWIDDLANEVSDMISENRSIKFSTHANRKAFLKKLRTFIKEITTKNIEGGSFTRYSRPTITKPNSNPSERQMTIMTESMSAKGDDPALLKDSVPKRTINLKEID